MRAVMSAALPGVKPTTTRTGLNGKNIGNFSCACALQGPAAMTAAK
jgi:hypothetical protein